MSVSILCPEDICLQHLNTRYHYHNNNDNSQSDFDDNNYCELQDDRNFDINDTLLKTAPIENFRNEDYLFVTKDNIEDNLFNEELILPNLEPVRITQNDLVNGKWTQNVSKSDIYKNNMLLELDNYKNDVSFEGIVVPAIAKNNTQTIAIVGNDKPIAVAAHSEPISINRNNEIITISGNNRPTAIIDNNKLNAIPGNNEAIVLSMNEKDQQIMKCTIKNSFQDVITVPNMGFNPNNNCYEQEEKNENNLYTSKESNDVDRNIDLSDPVTNISESVTNIDENVINRNETVININDTITNTVETVPNNNSVCKEEYSSEAENLSDNESIEDESTNKKTKVKREKEEDLFEKVSLTIEEQKAELERARKDENYVAASFKCHSCATYFHFKDTYQTHMMRHEESNGEHSCPICSLRFANPAVLRSHAVNHSDRYICRVCWEQVRARQRLTHARNCVGKRDAVNCHLCGKIFQSGQHFQQHMRRSHRAEKSNRNYLCNVCGKSFIARSRVRTHMITHINRKFECEFCSAVFRSPYTLNNHKRAKHETTEPQVHHCATCDIKYDSRKSLLAHKRNSLAHKESLYKCTICGRTCPSAAALTQHTACVHTRSRHLSCRLCHKRYSTTRALMQHMSKHKEGKPVPLCHSCGVTFKSTTVLNRHLKNVCEKDTRKSQNVIDEELLQDTFFV